MRPCLLVAGRAADVLGRRRMFLIGASLLLTGAIVGILATSAEALFGARIVQAAGAAALSRAAMSMLLSRTEGPARLKAMSNWGAASTIGGALGVSLGALGVSLGGLVAAAAGWNAIFAIPASAAAVALLLGMRWLPADECGARRSFDGAGAAMATGTALALAFAILSVPQHGWWSVPTVGGVLAGAGLAVLLMRHERRAPDPLFPQTVLSSPRVVAGLAVNMLGGGARIAAFVLVAFLLQRVLAMDVGAVGLAMLPTSLFGFAVSVALLPRLLARYGPERVTAIGCLTLAVAHLVFATATPGTSYVLHVLPALALAAAGVAMSFTPTTLVIAREVARRDSGVGSALASASPQLGGLLGIAVFGAVDALVTTGERAAGAAGVSAMFLVAAGFSAAAGMLALCGLVPRGAHSGGPRAMPAVAQPGH
nr:MFS transporter [Agrococcus sp. KRD186]